MTSTLPVQSPTRPRYSPWAYRRRLWGAAAVALVVHAVVYFSGKPDVLTAVEFDMQEPPGSVEVDLVESAPPEPVVEQQPVEPPPVEPPPEPVPEPEPPKPEPMPEPPKPVEEPMTPPEPKSEPKPEPKPAPKPVEKKPKPPASSTSAPPRTSTAPVSAKPVSQSGSAGAGNAASGAKGGGTTGPGYLYNPKPVYPAESRAAKENGTVNLTVSIDASGRPSSVNISKSSGFPRLDRAAQEAVRRWRFKPATKNGVPVPATTGVPVRFALPR